MESNSGEKQNAISLKKSSSQVSSDEISRKPEDDQDDHTEQNQLQETNDDADKKKARNDLLQAVEEGVVGSLVNLVFNKSCRKADILGVVSEQKYFHKGYARRFFAAAGEMLESIINEETYVPASAFVSDDENDIENSNRLSEKGLPEAEEIVPDEDSTEALLFMRACSMIICRYLEGMTTKSQSFRENAISEEIFSVAERLHDVLFSLQSCGHDGLATQASVCAMCQRWWYGHFKSRELLVTQLVPILLIKSLDINAKSVDIKNMHSIREALTLFDFEDGSISYLKSLLLKTVLCPLYHKLPEGTKFIIFIFQLHESLAIDLHRSIRTQIPQAKKYLLDSYSDIYLKVWKESTDGIRKIIEEQALQDLMYAVLHFEKASSVKAARAVLTPFHQGRKSPEIEELLYRMYSPILWRALNAANPLVRVNASAILAETFPLRKPSGNNAHVEECIERATGALQSLLRDSDPRVRIAGADASARILLDFWTALPSECIRRVLNEIITKHASDASSSVVRASAVSAVTLLLKSCRHSHAVLRSLLPSLGNLLHDKSERVRLSVVHMLLAVKNTKGIKFYHVVSVQTLLTRLAVEGEGHHPTRGPVASALTGLLLNSYFPQGENITGAIQVQRTLHLLSFNPKAAGVFYKNLHVHLSLNSISKLITMLLKCLRAAVRADQPSDNKQNDLPRLPDDNTSLGTLLTASNTTVMVSITETICCLWVSICDKLDEPGNEACKKFLFEAFSGEALTFLYEHFENKPSFLYDNQVSDEVTKVTETECSKICSGLLRCAAMMPEKNVSRLSQHIKSTISDFAQKGGYLDISLPIALLCVWGHTEDIFMSLASSMRSSISGHLKASHLPRTKRTKGKDNKEAKIIFDCSAIRAVKTLSKILNGSDSLLVVAREGLLRSEVSFKVVEKVLEQSMFSIEETFKPTFYKGSSENFDVSVPLLAFELYMRLSMHKAGYQGDMELNSNLHDLMQWITSTVLPVLLHVHPLGDLNVSNISGAESPISTQVPEPTRRMPDSNSALPSDRFSSNSFLHSFTFDYDNVSPYSQAVAVVTVKSACIVISEWLAVGGKGVNEIVNELVKWIPALRRRAFDLNIANELIPAYGRLIVQVMKTTRGCILLKELLTHCFVESGSKEEKQIQAIVLSLLSCQAIYREAVVSAILEVATSALSPSCLQNENDSKSSEFEFPAIQVALSQVMRNGPGIVLLARKISLNLSQCDSYGIDDESFQKCCLQTLLKESATMGKYGLEVREICNEILK